MKVEILTDYLYLLPTMLLVNYINK